jgi:DNA-binding HxlR family transcriptional regulator
MLSERLRSLEAEDLVTRWVIADTPVRVEYELTEKGLELQNAMREIAAWAERWIPAPISQDEDPRDEPDSREQATDQRTPATRA